MGYGHYKIQTISDIRRLREGQRRQCIEDLKAWMAFADEAEAQGLGVEDHFTWVDDDTCGISGVSVNGEIIDFGE